MESSSVDLYRESLERPSSRHPSPERRLQMPPLEAFSHSGNLDAFLQRTRTVTIDENESDSNSTDSCYVSASSQELPPDPVYPAKARTICFSTVPSEVRIFYPSSSETSKSDLYYSAAEIQAFRREHRTMVRARCLAAREKKVSTKKSFRSSEMLQQPMPSVVAKLTERPLAVLFGTAVSFLSTASIAVPNAIRQAGSLSNQDTVAMVETLYLF